MTEDKPQNAEAGAGAEAPPHAPAAAHPATPDAVHPHVPTTHGGGHGLPFQLPIIEKIKRRNVGRVAILYIVVAYLVLEVFELFFHLLEMPAWAGRAAVVLAILGWPAAILFAWAYEITPEGLKPSDEVDPKQSIARQTGRRLDRAIMAVLAIALAYFVVDKFWLSRHGTVEEPAVATHEGVERPDAATTSRQVGPEAPPTAAAVVPERSIAVLPFVDMSEKHDQEYFSDGLAEELIDRLAHSRDLKVIARTSSFAFKGRNEDVRVIAAKLGVAHLLEGSVRRSGTALRITAQLIRAADGTHLWSETYERRLTDIFKVQDEISSTVASALNAVLQSGRQGASAKEPDLEAYTLTQQGNYFAQKFTAKDTATAISYFRKATARDPTYAVPWMGLSSALQNQSFMLWVPSREGIVEGKKALDEALRLAPDSVRAHYELSAYYNRVEWDWEAEAREVEALRRIDPKDALFLPLAEAYVADVQGRFGEAARKYQQRLDLDPLSTWDMNDLARVEWAMGRREESLALQRKVIALNPEFSGQQLELGICLILMGKTSEGSAEIEKESDPHQHLVGMAIAKWATGDRRAADSLMRDIEVQQGRTSPYVAAEVHAFRGEFDAAFEWLDRAYAARDPNMIDIKSDPLLDSLHKQPRYAELLRRMRLPVDG